MEDLGSANGYGLNVELMPCKMLYADGSAIDKLLTPLRVRKVPMHGLTVININSQTEELMPDDMTFSLLYKMDFDECWTLSEPDEPVLEMLSKEDFVKNVIYVNLDDLTEDGLFHEPDPISERDKKAMMEEPYILDFELSFFKTDDSKYELYPSFDAKLRDIFKTEKLDLTQNLDKDDMDRHSNMLTKNREYLKFMFKYLNDFNQMPKVIDGTMELKLHKKIAQLRNELLEHYDPTEINWNTMYTSGVASDCYDTPIHFLEKEAVVKEIHESLPKLMSMLPTMPPLFVAVSLKFDHVSFDPDEDLELTTHLLKEIYEKVYS